MLPGSILSLVNWLLDCYIYYLTHPCQFHDLLKKPILLLNKIMLNPFTSALLYLAKHENKGRQKTLFIYIIINFSVRFNYLEESIVISTYFIAPNFAFLSLFRAVAFLLK